MMLIPVLLFGMVLGYPAYRYLTREHWIMRFRRETAAEYGGEA